MVRSVISLYKFLLHFGRQVDQQDNIITIKSYYYNYFGNNYEFINRYAIEREEIIYIGNESKKL